MKIEMTVTFLDGTTEDVDAVFADFVGFERTWQRSVAKFEQELRLTDLAWLAWSALTHRNKTKLKFDPDWIALVDNVGVREAVENPLDSASSDKSNLAKTPPTG
jgi:hypothetical protein